MAAPLPTPLGARAEAGTAAGTTALHLTPEDKRDIKRIERYLNNIRTMTARFLQSTSKGGLAEGTLYLARPGRLRVEYDPPMPVLIVADGTWLYYYDSELGQVNRMRLSETPAAALVRAHYDFSTGDLRVAGFKRGPGTLRLTLENMKNPDSGRLTLTFSDHPLILRKWKVLDAQGVETTVSLLDTRRDVPLAPKLFEFHDPTKPPIPFGQ